MRILYWNEIFLPDIGGAEINTAHLANRFQQAGHSCQVIASHGRTAQEDRSTYEGLPVRRFWFHRELLRRDLKSIRSLQRSVDETISEFRPDLIHLGTSQPSLFFYLHSRETRKIPTLATIYEPPHSLVDPHSLLGQALGRVRGISACSGAIRNALLQHLPELDSISRVIHLGLPMPDLDPGLPSWDPPRLLCAGRLVPEKGFDLALAAFAQLGETFPQLEMTIAGDGPHRAALIDQAESCGLGDRVTFSGWITPEEMPALMASHSIVLVPSRWNEPFGLVALEASQVARPVVAAADGGLPEVVAEETTGLLFPPGDVAGIRDAVARLLGDPDLAERLGAAGRKRAAELFSLDRQVVATETLYEEVLGKPRKP